MKKLFKIIISHLKTYHYRLRNSPVRQIVRSSSYCLDEHNVNRTTLKIALFGMLVLLVTILVVIA